METENGICTGKERHFIYATRVFYLGLIRRNFQVFNFKPKLSFLNENHQNDK